MDQQRFEAVVQRLSSARREAARHQGRLDSLNLNAMIARWLMTCVIETAAEAQHALVGDLNATEFPPAEYPHFLSYCERKSNDSGADAAVVRDQLLSAAEQVADECERIVREQFVPVEGNTLREDNIVFAVFTDNPWYVDSHGYSPFSWHNNRADADHNAAITGGVVVSVERDRDGDYVVPLEERLRLGVASLAV